MMTRELNTDGIDGSGNKVYAVITSDENGRQIWTERFDNEAEARNWIRWA